MCGQFDLLLLIVFAYCIYILYLHNGCKLTRRETMCTSNASMYAVKSGEIAGYEMGAKINK